MAIYLSTGMLEELSQRLIAGGYEKHTPEALVYNGNMEGRRNVSLTVETLACSCISNHKTAWS